MKNRLGFLIMLLVVFSFTMSITTSCCEEESTSKVTMELTMTDGDILTRSYRVPTNAHYSIRTEEEISYLYGFYSGDKVLKVPKVDSFAIVKKNIIHNGNPK